MASCFVVFGGVGLGRGMVILCDDIKNWLYNLLPMHWLPRMISR